MKKQQHASKTTHPEVPQPVQEEYAVNSYFVEIKVINTENGDEMSSLIGWADTPEEANDLIDQHIARRDPDERSTYRIWRGEVYTVIPRRERRITLRPTSKLPARRRKF
jgi:hypothetical protein